MSIKIFKNSAWHELDGAKVFDGTSWLPVVSNSRLYCNNKWNVVNDTVNWIVHGSYRIVSGNTTFYNNSIVTSPEGIYWLSSSGGGGGRKIAFNGNIWLVCSGSRYISWSTDGRNWTNTTSLGESVNSVAWNGTEWLAVGGLNTSSGMSSVFKSTDGRNWTGLPGNWFCYPTDIIGTGYDIAWNGNRWVGVGATYEGYTNSSSSVSITGKYPIIITSTDGVSWTQQKISTTEQSVVNGIAWNGSLWVASGSRRIYTSSDGTSWQVDSSPFYDYGANKIVWNGSLWVLGGTSTSSVIYTSTTGSVWVARGNPFNIDEVSDALWTCSDIAWDGNMFVAVGGHGDENNTNDCLNIATSPDGINWTARGTRFKGGSESIVSMGDAVGCRYAPNLYPPIT